MTGWTIYEILSPVIVALLAWAASRLSDYIKAKVESERVASALVRITDSIVSAVKMVDQTVKQTLMAEKAKATAEVSPGGTAITSEEAESLKDAVWHQLKVEYGGVAGIEKILGALGVDRAKVPDWVDGRIEAAVNDLKASRGPPGPAARSNTG